MSGPADPPASIELLIEAALRREQEADAAVARFDALTRELEQIVREEIRGAFVEEFAALGEASRLAGEALHALRRTASVRLALWCVLVVAACCAIPVVIARTVLPSGPQLAHLQAERDSLAAGVTELARRGGRIDLRRCGASGRLCARIDLSAPAYGRDRDYRVLEGY